MRGVANNGVRCPRAVGLAVVLMVAAAAAHAQSIGSMVSVNRSDADALVETTGGYRYAHESRSNAAMRPAMMSGNAVSLGHRFSFAGGLSFERGATAAPVATATLGGSHELGYDLSFSIDDPGASGYTLSLDTLLAGLLRVTSPGTAFVPAFTVSIDHGQGFVDLPALATDSHLLDGTGGLNSLVVNQTGQLTIGEFFGTRSFDIRVRTPGDDMRTTGTSAGDPHRAHLQFGEPTTSPLLPGGSYPAFDGSQRGDHGHFLTVQAVFNTSPVPEPGSWALLAAGLGVVVLRSRQGAGSRGHG